MLFPVWACAAKNIAVTAHKNFIYKIKPRSNLSIEVLTGAANAIRTRDLVLTKDVLCLLSHSSIRKRQDELAFCGDPERARTVDL